MGDKCERYRKGHESHYIPAKVYIARVLHARRGPYVMRFMPFAVLLALITHPTSGEPRTKRSTAVVQTVTASVTVWLRETNLRECIPTVVLE